MTAQTRSSNFAGAPVPVVKRRALLGLVLATFVTAGCDMFLPGSKTPFNGVDITGSDRNRPRSWIASLTYSTGSELGGAIANPAPAITGDIWHFVINVPHGRSPSRWRKVLSK